MVISCHLERKESLQSKQLLEWHSTAGSVLYHNQELVIMLAFASCKSAVDSSYTVTDCYWDDGKGLKSSIDYAINSTNFECCYTGWKLFQQGLDGLHCDRLFNSYWTRLGVQPALWPWMYSWIHVHCTIGLRGQTGLQLLQQVLPFNIVCPPCPAGASRTSLGTEHLFDILPDLPSYYHVCNHSLQS